LIFADYRQGNYAHVLKIIHFLKMSHILDKMSHIIFCV
jgi:hypothetical protein